MGYFIVYLLKLTLKNGTAKNIHISSKVNQSRMLKFVCSHITNANTSFAFENLTFFFLGGGEGGG